MLLRRQAIQVNGSERLDSHIETDGVTLAAVNKTWQKQSVHSQRAQ